MRRINVIIKETKSKIHKNVVKEHETLPISKDKMKYTQVTKIMMVKYLIHSVSVFIPSLKCDPDLSYTWESLRVHSQGSTFHSSVKQGWLKWRQTIINLQPHSSTE